MKVFVIGGTGFIGSHIVDGLMKNGHEVVALTRSAAKGAKVLGDKVKIVEGNPMNSGSWQKDVDGCDAAIIMCGEPIIDKKWTSERKQVLLDSRIKPTKMVIEAIKTAKQKPKVLLCGSAIGFYGNGGDKLLTEDGASGSDFSAELCSRWEEEANKAADLGVRVVNLRTSFVLAKDGGALGKMLKPFKFFMGGPIGGGRQYMSWIHIDDYVAITQMALGNEKIAGPLNMSAPNPVTNKEFSKVLGRVLGKPSFAKAPAFVLKLMLGEASSLVLEGQRVIPKKALGTGYKFEFETLGKALKDVV